jgi:ribokinase
LPPSPRVTVVGSINLDLVARCDRLPGRGETITGASFERVPGGKGANQAVAAARLRADVTMVGCIGEDAFGEEALTGLRAAGVKLDVSVDDDAPTGVALIFVAEDGENEIVVAPGANWHLDPRSVRVGEADALLCQLEIPDEAILAAAEQASGMFCLNAAPARPVSDDVLARADLIVVNSIELDALGSSPVGRLFAVTLGSQGALLLEGGEEVARASPPPVEPVDGTAAGDAFIGCLVVSLLEGRPREEALRRACAAGALAASRPGAQPSLPTAAEVDEILAG